MREAGFYWVKRRGEWVVCEWAEIEYWFVCGVSCGFMDLDMDEIDERRIVREEVK